MGLGIEMGVVVGVGDGGIDEAVAVGVGETMKGEQDERKRMSNNNLAICNVRGYGWFCMGCILTEMKLVSLAAVPVGVVQAEDDFQRRVAKTLKFTILCDSASLR
jgi:hypothetical protein